MTIEFAPNRNLKWLLRIPKGRYIKRYLVFDVESHVTKVSDKKFAHKPFLWISQLIDLHSVKKPIVYGYNYHYTINEFHEHLIYQFTKTKTLYLIAHNTNYDFTVSEMFVFMDNNNFTIDLYNPQREAFIIIAHSGDKKLIIIDNLNFFKGALDDIGLEIGFKKLKIPKDTDSLDKWKIYCKQDVKIVTECLLALSKICKPYGMGDLRITRAKLAFDIFMSKFCKQGILLHKEEKVMSLEIDSYYGGRTEAFYQGVARKGLKYYVDFNSLYPSVMFKEQFSTRLRYYFKEISLDKLKSILDTHNVCARVMIKTDKPIYPYFAKDMLLFPVGTFVTTLSYPELKEAFDRKHIVKVYEGAAYYFGDLFSDYISHFHALKQKYKVDKKPAFRYFAKLMLNSLYGKFGQHIPQLVWTGEKSDKRFELAYVIDHNLNREYTERTLNYRVYAETKRQISKYSSPIITAEITSYARLKLWKMLEKAGLEHCYYCDTDSIILDKYGYRKLKKYIKDGLLGFLELEKTSSYCEIFGLKDYKFGSSVRHKGVPNDAEEIELNKFKFMQWTTINQSLRYYAHERYSHGIVTKQLTRNITKGVKQRSNRVYPWNLNLKSSKD